MIVSMKFILSYTRTENEKKITFRSLQKIS